MQERDQDLCRHKLELAIDALVAVIPSGNGLLRQAARRALVSIGEPALPALAKALHDGDENARWEAAKALGEMAEPAAAEDLVEALEDEAFSVRWLAAEGLIALEYDSLEPLLQALEKKPDSVWLRESTHHVLKTLDQKGFHHFTGRLLASLDKGEEPAMVLTRTKEALTRLEEETQARQQAVASLNEGYRTRNRAA